MRKLSFLLTFIFTLLIIFQWYKNHTSYKYSDQELLNEMALDEHLKDFDLAEFDRIVTGVYIDSLQFLGANDVHLSGYIWQEFNAELLNKHTPGVIFPNSLGATIMEESYKNSLDNITVIGWYFEVNLRQPFSYADYPIDHKTVHIKILPQDFNSNVILVPSLKSYDTITVDSIFGVSKDIVLAGWDINDTYFDYIPLSFDTDFGLHDNHPKINLPELSFNIVIERDFFSVFIISLTLLLVSMALLYCLILMMTSDEKLSSKFDSSVSSSIGSCAGIFFVVLIAHINVREQFPGAGIVYIEYLYLLSYIFILSTIVSIYSFNIHGHSEAKGFFANEAALLKRSFWPVYSCCICLITWYHFY